MKGVSPQNVGIFTENIVKVFYDLVTQDGAQQLSVNMEAVLTPCIATLLLLKPDADFTDLHRFFIDERNEDLVQL